ncbi:hypothetical protein Q8A73_003165 [Channa argus]|nr:hypothetical protein Q8A73_003165 [Channa argus]
MPLVPEVLHGQSSTGRGRQCALLGRLGCSEDLSLPTRPCLYVLIGDWNITGILVRPLLAPIHTQEEGGVTHQLKINPTRRGGGLLSCAYFGGRQNKQSAGHNSRVKSQRVGSECHRSEAVYFCETGWFDGATASPSRRLWTGDRR